MTDWMTIPKAVAQLDGNLTELVKKIEHALRGIYDREDETKERIAALEAKVQDLQGQLRRADNNIAGLMRKAARESGITLPSNVTEQVLDGGVREQEQPQGKPSWDDAPEWAQWLAQSAEGCWYWHSHKPAPRRNTWDNAAEGATFTGMASNAHVIPNPNWQDTLERRPEQEQQEGWSILKNSLVDVIGYNDEEISDTEIIDLLILAGITPDTSNEDLAMLNRCLEMRERGLDLVNRAVQVWGDDDTFGNDLAGWMRELLGEVDG